MTLAPKGFGAQRRPAGRQLRRRLDQRLQPAQRPPLGPLRSADGKPIALGGLWDLERGTATVGGENALWFSAGSDGGTHGVLGVIRPAGASTSAPAASPSATPAPSASHPSSHSNSNSNSGSGY